ncbi:unnamed protein product [Pleuronectes platessa]|uniref:Uncharacterized protein n=1 Tax=Pleuronectes platessa TaxID=8262 RepID=A0A9N7V966_PLEPL|nr:unnamed protein product [Pleuronectes platessa]
MWRELNPTRTQFPHFHGEGGGDFHKPWPRLQSHTSSHSSKKKEALGSVQSAAASSGCTTAGTRESLCKGPTRRSPPSLTLRSVSRGVGPTSKGSLSGSSGGDKIKTYSTPSPLTATTQRCQQDTANKRTRSPQWHMKCISEESRPGSRSGDIVYIMSAAARKPTHSVAQLRSQTPRLSLRLSKHDQRNELLSLQRLGSQWGAEAKCRNNPTDPHEVTVTFDP